MRTLAGSGIGDARAMFAFQQKHSPLGRGVTLDELGGSALYLLSDLSGGVTGEIHYVDSGYNVISMPRPEDLKANSDAAIGAVVAATVREACTDDRLRDAQYSTWNAMVAHGQARRDAVTHPPRSSPRAGMPGAPCSASI